MSKEYTWKGPCPGVEKCVRVETLTDEVDNLKAEKGMADMGFVSEGAAKRIDELTAENKDLKAALEGVLPYVNNRKPMCNAECLGTCKACVATKIAQELVKEEPNDPPKNS